MIQLKQWKHRLRIRQKLLTLGQSSRSIYFELPKRMKRYWYLSGLKIIGKTLDVTYFEKLGYPGSSDLNSTNRLVRTRMPGGVAGARREIRLAAPLCLFFEKLGRSAAGSRVQLKNRQNRRSSLAAKTPC
jgi:hypothetical protein